MEDGEANEVDHRGSHKYIVEPKSVSDIGRHQGRDGHHHVHGNRREGESDSPLLTGREAGSECHAGGHTQDTEEPVSDKEEEEGPEVLDEEGKGKKDVRTEKSTREPSFLPEPGGEFSSEGASDDTY